jgi:hypothetical protein
MERAHGPNRVQIKKNAKGEEVKTTYPLIDDFPKLKNLKKALKDQESIVIPGSICDSGLDEGLVALARRGKWRHNPDFGKYFEGDHRAPNTIRLEAMAIRKQKEDAVSAIYSAPLPADEAKQRIDEKLDAIADIGKPKLMNFTQAFEIDNRGNWRVQRGGEWELPHQILHGLATVNVELQTEKGLLAGEAKGTARIPTDDLLSLLIWGALPIFRQRCHEIIDNLSATLTGAIPMAERKALLKAAHAELLDAQRREEAANKICEDSGLTVIRPSQWPAEVLLEVEPDVFG